MDRRRRDLVATFMDALGGPSVVNDLTQVRKAAELTALAEATRARMLLGAVTDITALIRIEGEARRACRALGLKIESPPARARGLELARQRWAEDAERAKRKATESAGEAPATHTTEVAR
jgi:hypothetical protein